MKKSTLQSFTDDQEQLNYIHEILVHDYKELIPYLNFNGLAGIIQHKMGRVATERTEALDKDSVDINDTAEQLNVDPEKVIDSYIIFNLIVENSVLVYQLNEVIAKLKLTDKE